LRYNGLYSQAHWIGPELEATPDVVDVCFEHLRTMAPYQQWLVKLGHRFGF